MLRFASIPDRNSVELELMEAEEIPQAKGDARFHVSVTSHGFSGSAVVWVHYEQVQTFARSLMRLNTTLSGCAEITSISPGEMELQVLSVSSRGHFAVKGTIGCHAYEMQGRYRHSLSFGFEFEPSELEAAIHEPWVASEA